MQAFVVTLKVIVNTVEDVDAHSVKQDLQEFVASYDCGKIEVVEVTEF